MTFRVLDLFCGEGGAAQGYRQAGASVVVGVDLQYQRRYPFQIFEANALTLDVTLRSVAPLFVPFLRRTQ